MKRKIFSILIALSMLLTLLPANVAYAATGTDIVNDLNSNYVGQYPYERYTHGPGSFDCSGLVYYIYKQHGISLPMSTKSDWSSYGTVITDVSQLKDGDILFFGSSYSNISHEGIYDSNGGYIIHALNSKYGIIRKPTLSIWINTPAWNSYGSNQFQYARRIINDVHTHSWSYGNDASHPHKEYRTCSCGEKQYTGATRLVSSCRQCYPVGNVSLTRSYNRTAKDVTLYRNNVSNANEYTLTLYRNGSQYGTYNMSSASKYISQLSSGTYYATLTAKNTGTGETRSASCDTFTIVDTYAVTYDANGGTNAPSAQTKIKDEDMTITSAYPRRTGYIFKGWASNKTATEPQYQSGGVYTKNTPITLYAVWEPEIYTISFDVNGGKGEVESTTITYGNTMKMPNTVIKEGSYLKGWSQTKGASTPDYKLGMDYMLTADMTLYAVWGQSTWGGTVAADFAGGDGTEENPYQISTAAELAHLADIVNNQQSAPEYAYYILTDNINLGYEEWIPIGLYENENQYFRGSFDGNGYTISDLSITNVNEGYVGLFGYAKGGEIKNLTVSGDITGITGAHDTDYIGAVIAYADNTDIDSCNISYVNISDIESDNQFGIGGICGDSTGNITNCEANECYVGVTKVYDLTLGMIAGSCNTITNCKVASTEELFGATEKISHFYFGGICAGATNIERCSVKAGAITSKITSGGMVFGGGIVGLADNSVNLCSVQLSNGFDSNIEGINIKSSIYINSAAYSGYVNGVGGIVGVIDNNDATLSNCKYNGQSIILNKSVSGYYCKVAIGGIIGYERSPINRCFSVVDGVLYSNALQNDYSFSGGIAGIADSISNSTAIADSIISKADTWLYTYSGDVVGASHNKNNYEYSTDIEYNNVYTNSGMEVSATNTYTAENAETNVIASKRTLTQIKRASFLNQVYGPAYQSVEYLEENPDAVWVIKDGEYPELYFNVLRDITLSDVENGTISVDKTQAVDGEIVTVTAVPAENYVLNKIYVNGNEITGTTFEVDGDSDVYATFAEKTAEYSVRVEATDNASATLVNTDTITPYSVSLFSNTDSISAEDGEEIAVSTSADENYTVDAVYVNGEEMASDSFIVTDDSVVTMDVKSISTDIEATTYDAADVDGDVATLGGYVEDSEEVIRYVRYWKTDTPDEVYTTEVQDGGGKYSVVVENLEPDTEYSYQMCDTGEIKTFTATFVPSEADGDGEEINEPTPEPTPVPEPCFTMDMLDTYADVENTGAEQAVAVIIAEYDADGALVNVSTEDVLFAEDEIKRFDVPSNGKIFIWNSLPGMFPMTK